MGKNDEQNEMLAELHRIQGQVARLGRKWNRYRGEAAARIAAHYLRRHLPEGFKLALRAWVEGVPNELDILIVDAKAEPFKFTNAYKRDQVHLILEVKAAGVYYPRKNVEAKLRSHFSKLRSLSGKPVLYLTFYEGHKTVEPTFNAVGMDSAFILQIDKDPKPGEWERFLKKVEELLT